ncbi:hypothetical protein A3I46_00960 [Candidatus Kaiserbacteria bacterium RIFCSPLOWO2_02_FULL_54_13]|uniref:Uncharacterized protein n=1 Tax=Candidatus Kaiserbacteria bacterium RIFCSPHIGHO2_02_FULL_54_22 TaxID=1798495 RepID=A0A1F6DNB1_9BACT|nr:MAG: Adenylyl-sulfate kinase [Parcubacteria group bacterium GW2011_GWA1_54_9]KKW42775.1 MAG: Adenylyl-sulfate kinase [Parcubacteria group bacterium GW2011_GWB1_55_9]OGG62951.1 MAG: hypothetical protein A3C19_02445 [Candidatus Kaiserbacteria bacterium RIFCSPHIGHO2_02_FULL_54_22]OGG67997.1 MAG: hypothetical protein A3E99_01780 [Candidatus Kaiserbacteria bacterium RIFCSPHIGHO2_12_FULL_54_16]OGG83595.1 MAG: hypothetical protein A3I46_00960 [Candidatus Kaiserbacteria bacterium RIFCSPLOWO2_02_FULL
MDTSHPRVIAIDFDGVLATYNGFVAKDDIQEPNPEVIKAITLLREKNFKILLHSTRGDEFLKMYCEKFSIPVDYINRRPDVEGDNPGKPIAFAYVDDKAICYRGETAEALVSEILNFEPYWQK